MKAIVYSNPGGPDVLHLEDVEEPKPQRGEVRVRVRATAVNRADLKQREGKYPAPAGVPANVLGLEYAGEVDQVGDDVFDLKVGDRVFGLVGGGSYAEYVTVHERATSKIPDHLDFVDAAAYPEAFVTAYDAMVTQCRLSAGETVLIHAAASGVGTAAIQIAHAIGAHPIGTTRSESKLPQLRMLGLNDSIVAKDGKFSEAVLNATKNVGVNVILELVGGDYVSEDLQCIAQRGRLVLVGLIGGASCKLNLGAVLMKRVELRGTTLRARPLEEKILAAQILSKNIVPLIHNGKVKAVVDRAFALKDARLAHELMEKDETFGKVILTV